MSETHGSHTRSTFRLREPRLADLDSAVEWLRERWDGQRTAPMALNVDDTEGELGGLRYTGAFAAALSWDPRASRQVTYGTICAHPMSHGRTDECPECQGSGVTERTAYRFPFPMSTALEAVSRVVTRSGQVPAVLAIFALATSGFRPRVAGQLLGLQWALAEPVLLASIRQLFHHYQAGPTATTPWTQLSESQQQAVVAGEFDAVA